MINIQFELNPTLPFINTEAVKGFFYVQYPSGFSYWEIQDNNGLKLKDGNYTFSQEILSQWTTSDQVLIDDILAAQPWAVVSSPVQVIEEVVQGAVGQTENTPSE